MSDNQCLVEIKDLSFSRGGRKIFDGLNLKISKGKLTAVMGPSGTGKTTLLMLIGGELYPDSGQILFDGVDVHKQSRKELYQLRKRMGLMFQTGALFTDMNVFDNVAFPLREHTDLSEEMIRDLVLIKLEAVGLRGAINLNIGELSGGMARRVSLARSVALDPELMMYDEPFTGQDPITMGVIVKLIKQLNDSLKLTSVLVSHDVSETASIADYIYLLSQGKVIGEGAPDALFKDDTPEIKQFIHGLPDGAVPFHFPSPTLQEDLLSD